MKDIRRVFEFHGAEHKVIAAFEEGKKLTIDNIRSYTTRHPRCGTSFLFISVLMCILLFACADAVVIQTLGPYPSVIARVLAHLLMLPPVAGISYEILKFSSSHRSVIPVNFFVSAGLGLQRITTREPDDEQMAVAVRALEAVL
jgi:uncharacterized protein YqhQ